MTFESKETARNKDILGAIIKVSLLNITVMLVIILILSR